jgi:hypothetical protein
MRETSKDGRLWAKTRFFRSRSIPRSAGFSRIRIRLFSESRLNSLPIPRPATEIGSRLSAPRKGKSPSQKEPAAGKLMANGTLPPPLNHVP